MWVMWGMDGRRKVHLLRKMQLFISTNKYKNQRDNRIYKRGVSHAVRPLSVVHCVSTSRMAQKRRTLLMARDTLKHTLLACAHPRTLATSYPQLMRVVPLCLCILSAVALFFGVTLFFWPTLLAYWPVLLFLALLCVATTFTITWVILLDKPALAPHSPISYAEAKLPARAVAAPTATYIPVSALDFSHPFSSIPQSQFSPVPAEVNTPMPVPPTPLVRVLETIDLSSTNVEHFLDIKTPINYDSGLDIQNQSTPWPESKHGA